MTSSSSVGFGVSAASMTATWIWAASFYAAATSGYKYGISGPIHYGLWGALMILFIYPFGRRFRELAPEAHKLAEIIHARHGRSSQLILAGSNIVGSVISLMANFTAAGAVVAVLSPLDFVHGVLIASLYWKRVTNRAFTTAVAVPLVFFIVSRFQLLPIEGVLALVFEVMAALGAGVVLGLMAFGFFSRRVGIGVGVVGALGLMPFMLGFLRDYPVLLSSLNAYGVSTLVCTLISMRNRHEFDFELIKQRVTAFQTDDADAAEA